MKKVIIIAVFFSLWSCKETAKEEFSTYFYFEGPQPINDSELSSFPSKFRGVYTFDDVQLHIEKNCIYNSYLEDWRVAKTAMDSLKDSIIYDGDKIILKEKKYSEKYNYRDEGDSLYLYRRRYDTIFSFSPTQKAKRINGQLVLSNKDSIYWHIRMLAIKKDTLYWKYFTDSHDYMMLKPIVKNMTINADTSAVYLKPTRREFAKILSLDSLATSKYKKIK
jgi:hypothetical protein